MTWAVIRVRGKVNVDGKIKDTLKMLRLNQTNHCVIIPESATYKGMLQVVKDYVTWGEIESKTMSELLKKRGKLLGGAKLTDKAVKDTVGLKRLYHTPVREYETVWKTDNFNSST